MSAVSCASFVGTRYHRDYFPLPKQSIFNIPKTRLFREVLQQWYTLLYIFVPC